MPTRGSPTEPDWSTLDAGCAEDITAAPQEQPQPQQLPPDAQQKGGAQDSTAIATSKKGTRHNGHYHGRPSQRAQLRGAAATAVVRSPREVEFMQELQSLFFNKVHSVAVVVLKAVVEASDFATLYRDAMGPYHNSLHAFFDRHDEEYYIWNYTAEDIAEYNLAPYFKTDETRVAARRIGDQIVDRVTVYKAAPSRAARAARPWKSFAANSPARAAREGS